MLSSSNIRHRLLLSSDDGRPQSAGCLFQTLCWVPVIPLTQWLYIAVACGLVALAVYQCMLLVRAATYELKTNNSWRGKRNAIVSVIFAAFILIASAFIIGITTATRSFMKAPTGRAVLGTIMVVGFSGILFRLKTDKPWLYGLLEMGFALIVCLQTLSGMKEYIKPMESAALMASVYLFVRAFDNLNKGWTERKARKLREEL
jgi:hypothetical protein